METSSSKVGSVPGRKVEQVSTAWGADVLSDRLQFTVPLLKIWSVAAKAVFANLVFTRENIGKQDTSVVPGSVSASNLLALIVINSPQQCKICSLAADRALLQRAIIGLGQRMASQIMNQFH
jgi:hypothetical protein